MPDPRAQEKSTLTNVLLQQILNVMQDVLTSNKAILVALGNLQSNSDSLLTVEKGALVVAEDSRDYLAQLAETGGSTEHTYTVKVQQLDSKRKPKLQPQPVK